MPHWPDEQNLSPEGKYCGTLDVSKKAEIPVVRRQTLHIHYVAPLRPSSVPPYSESSICWYKSFPTSCFQGKSRNMEPHLLHPVLLLLQFTDIGHSPNYQPWSPACPLSSRRKCRKCVSGPFKCIQGG